MKLFRFISQKIKDLINRFKKHFLIVRVKPEISVSEKVKLSEPVDTTPKRVPINDSNVKYALEYILNLAENKDVSFGVGILVKDLGDLSHKNSFSELICNTFKYVTIYTENMSSADRFGDYIYDRYGLPIMILGSSEFSKCKYQVIIDLVSGKLRYGRDICIDGVMYDRSDNIVGISSGKRIIST